MNFDLARESDKLLMLLYGLIAFVVVVGGLILLLEVVPSWLEKRRIARRRPGKRTEGRLALFFLLPALLLLGIGLVVPAVRTTGLSFMDAGSDSWVGLANYRWMFAQDDIRAGPAQHPDLGGAGAADAPPSSGCSTRCWWTGPASSRSRNH